MAIRTRAWRGIWSNLGEPRQTIHSLSVCTAWTGGRIGWRLALNSAIQRECRSGFHHRRSKLSLRSFQAGLRMTISLPSESIVRDRSSKASCERVMSRCLWGGGSRMPTLVSALIALNEEGAQDKLKNVIERAADPRDFLSEPEKFNAVLEYLNTRLKYDGLELCAGATGARLSVVGKSASVVDALANTVKTIDFDTVSRDLQRALASAESDPEDAVTSACSVIESVCRSILVELKLPLPEKRDIQGLYRAVRDPLGLAPEKTGVRDEIADDVRLILGGINSAIFGIGSLRTHGGDAHGRERGTKRSINSRIARLAIHAASAAALFLIETWQQKFPTAPLHAH